MLRFMQYLLLRPHPSLRILFTSPSLRVPGILQSRFLDRIGGSTRVRDSLAEALADGSRGVTAKIRWLSSAAASLNSDRSDEGRPRWIHCTPLLGAAGTVGVWMVVLVDDEKSPGPVRRFRPAPPVPSNIRQAQHGESQDGSQASVESSEDEFDLYSRRSSLRAGGTPRPLFTVRALRNGASTPRPGSAGQATVNLSEQRAEPSIDSFALA